MNCHQSLMLPDPATYGEEPEPGDLIPRQEEYLSRIPRFGTPLMERAFTGRTKLWEVVEANCLACAIVHRKEVEFCTLMYRPLWRDRTFQERTYGSTGRG